MKLNDLIQYPQSERTRKKINEILRPIFENNSKNKKQKFYEKISAKIENSNNENTGAIKIQLKTFFAIFEIEDGKIVDMFFRSRKYKKKTYSFISLEDIKKMETEKIQKVGQILAEHLKDNKNILILGEDYLTGKTILLNKIMENLENKEKILFISKNG